MADPRLVVRVEASSPLCTYISFGPAEQEQELPDGRMAFVLPIFITVPVDEIGLVDGNALMRTTRAQTDLPLPVEGIQAAKITEIDEEDNHSLAPSGSITEENYAPSNSEELVEDFEEMNLQEERVNHQERDHLEDMAPALAPPKPMPLPTPIVINEVKYSLTDDPAYKFIYRNDRYMQEIRGFKSDYTSYREARAWEEELMQTNLKEMGRKARKTFHKKLESVREKADQLWRKIDGMVRKFRQEFPPYLEKYYSLPPLPARE